MHEPESDSIDIFVIGDDVRTHTGFAMNGRTVCRALADDYDIANMSSKTDIPTKINLYGSEMWILPSGAQSRGNPISIDQLERLLSKYNPSIIITIIDIRMMGEIAQLHLPCSTNVSLRNIGEYVNKDAVISRTIDAVSKIPNTPRFTWVAQIPVDGEPLPEYWEGYLKEVDHTITMSEYGSKIIETQFGISTVTIPHAVEKTPTSNIENDTEANVFYVGSVNENQFRKQYPLLLDSFKLFYEKAGRPDDIKFYLHANPDGGYSGWNLEKQIRKREISHLFEPYKGNLSRKELLELYSKFDIFASATSGEGFGLTTAEALYQGCPVVITDYSTSEELIVSGDPSPRGTLVDPAMMYDATFELEEVERALVDTTEFAEALLDYYLNPGKVDTEGENARKWAQQNISFERVSTMWSDYIKNEVGLQPTK